MRRRLLQAVILAVVSALVGAWFTERVAPRPYVVFGRATEPVGIDAVDTVSFEGQLPAPDKAWQVAIQNRGRKGATDVEIVCDFPPRIYAVQPLFPTSVSPVLASSRPTWIIHLGALAAHEVVYIYLGPVLYWSAGQRIIVRSDEGVAPRVDIEKIHGPRKWNELQGYER